MKYLAEAFKNNFVELKGDKEVNSGSGFEKLVFMLLKHSFSDIGWKDTPITHDGSKDFYAQKDNRVYWAECKNYNNKVSLQTIAPTLIMAELCNADEVYFFSHSEINDNVKKKLCYYAHINHKKIRFYDDLALEQLIFNNEVVYKNFFEKYQFTNVDFQKEAVPKILFNYLKNPFLNYQRGDTFFNKTSQPVLKVNEIISLQVCGINNNHKKSAYITITIDKTSEDLFYFELLDKKHKRSEIKTYYHSDEIPPNEIFFHNIDLKIIKYKPKLILPKIHVEIVQAEYTDKNNLVYGSFECIQLQRAELLGPNYHNILLETEHKLLNNEVLSGCLLIGSSGTGKSRLLEEMLSFFVKYDYKILNFIGNEYDSGTNIIKEIVYILFEVSEELIAQSFFLRDQQTSHSFRLATQMLYELNQRSKNIINIIDEYGEIIYERLIRSKYALVIDNLQFFDQPLLYFIEKLIMYGKNCNRINNLFMALSLNTDYSCGEIGLKKIKTLFHQLQGSSACKFKTCYIDGFATNGSALEFIKQLLGVRNKFYDNFLEKVIEKSSLNPYYIESIIENLNQFKSASYTEEGFTITQPTLFCEELAMLPIGAKENLEKRWQFFLSTHFDENYYVDILSIIHVFGGCSTDLVQTIQLNDQGLKELCLYNFLKVESHAYSERYIYKHDLIENFFCSYIPDLNKYAFHYIKNIQFDRIKVVYPIVYNLCILEASEYTPAILKNIILSGSRIEIPYKIFYNYYHNCIKALLYSFEKFDSQKEWYYLCLFSCTQVKLRLGNKSAHTLSKQLFSAFESEIFSERFQYTYFSDLLFFYGEIKQQLTLFDEVISLYLYYLQEYKTTAYIDSDSSMRFIFTFIYNRLSVAYKHCPGESNRQKQMKYVNKSLYESRTLENRQYLAENLYDKGTFYYCHIKYKKKALAYWSSCCNIIEKYHIELMTLHYIEHKIQIALIQQELSSIPNLLDFGFDYIKHGKYNEQGSYFERFFNQAKAIYWLLNRTNYDIVKDSLNRAEEALLMLGKNNLTYINYLRGKLYYYIGDKRHCYEFYKKAYEQSAALTILYKTEFINMLTDDMLIKFRHMELAEEQYPMDFLLDDVHITFYLQLFAMNNRQFSDFINNYQAKSIIRSLDNKENFPNI